MQENQGGKGEREDAPDSRASAHPLIEKAIDRVEYITGLMADQIWTPDTTRRLQKELADAWGVSPSTVRNYSNEASHSLLSNVRERRAELAKIAIEKLVEVAECEVAMPGDRAAKVAASKTLLEFAGVDKPDEDKIHKHVVAGMTDATPEKAREVIRGLFGDVVPDGSPEDLA